MGRKLTNYYTAATESGLDAVAEMVQSKPKLCGSRHLPLSLTGLAGRR